jgi:hypothetical protein
MPRQIFVYFYEGNDIEDNLNFAAKVMADFSRVTPEQIDRYLDEHYAAESFWRCHLALLDSASRMVQFLYQHHVSGLDLEYCGANEPHANRLVVDGQILDAPALQGPAVALADKLIQIGVGVLDRSLAWLQHRFEDVPITIVYIPSPLSVYRIAGETAVYCSSRIGSADVARSLRNSDLMSGLVQRIATSRGMGFIDARPALRSVAATTLITGPGTGITSMRPDTVLWGCWSPRTSKRCRQTELDQVRRTIGITSVAISSITAATCA